MLEATQYFTFLLKFLLKKNQLYISQIGQDSERLKI